MVRLVIFDLDNTLSESRRKISSSMAMALSGLLSEKDIAIISGGLFEQIDFQVLSELPVSADLSRLTLLPQSGTSCLRYKTSWEKVYAFNLTEDEKKRIYDALAQVAHIEKPEKTFEPLIEDKGGQITYSVVGIHAPVSIKESFDPDHSKRIKIISALRDILPGFEIGIGGTSSIDITRHGMDKSFGIKKLLEVKGLQPDEAVFMGDALFEGGNDAPARLAGVRCIQVANPDDTERQIEIVRKMK